MKNLVKFGFLALAITLSASACNSTKTDSGADSTLVDSATTDTTMLSDTTAVLDSTVAVDSAAAH